MNADELIASVKSIVADAFSLNQARTSEKQVKVNYACVFTHSLQEFEELVKLAGKLGTVVKDTSTGPVYYTIPISTIAGNLRVLKIRHPDVKRSERGDADFTVPDYASFKKAHLGKPGFNLITRPNMEMIELIDPSYDVIAYYSHPTLAEDLKLKID